MKPKRGMILVTGASRGLGLAISRELLGRGWSVTAVQRTETPELHELKAQHGEAFRVFSCDLNDVDALEHRFREEWFANDQAVAGLVNNAGMAYDDLVSNFQMEPFEAMFRLNCLAPLVLSKAVIRRMLLTGEKGALVHISSLAGNTGIKGLAMYGGSKGFLEAFSRGVAREWGSRGIRSNCVVPGFMETEMSRGLGSEQRTKIYRRTALGSATELESVAATVAFLLSAEASSITGQSLAVDGGAR